MYLTPYGFLQVGYSYVVGRELTYKQMNHLFLSGIDFVTVTKSAYPYAVGC